MPTGRSVTQFPVGGVDLFDNEPMRLQHDSLHCEIVGCRSKDGIVDYFRGIPYATVPGRWRQSVRLDHPGNHLDAMPNGYSANFHGLCANRSPKCPQPSERNNTSYYGAHLEFPTDVEEDEYECLNLLIARPSGTVSTDKLPCLVWIHGGGFAFGAGTDPMWDPTEFVKRSRQLDQPLLVVSINYRLNFFGFAACAELLSESGTCNYGIHDQQNAIDWVCKHIGGFGGDPENITVGGQSAGGVSVHSHLRNNPVFKRAIIQSGAIRTTRLRSLAWHEGRWLQLCKHFGFEKMSRTNQVACMRGVPAEQLVQVSTKMGIGIFPLLENNFPSSDLRDSKVEELLVGDMASELGGVSLRNKTTSSILKAFDQCPRKNEILSTYNIDPSDREQVVRGVSAFQTDVMFNAPIDYLCKEWPSEKQLFRYHVTHGNPFPNHFLFGEAHHCVDLIFIFNCFVSDLNKTSAREIQLAKDWSQIWIGFCCQEDGISDGWTDIVSVAIDGRRLDKLKTCTYFCP